MTYQEKLKDPRWQKKRLEILERDDWVCQRCMDGDATLHVHHKAYFNGKEPWDIENSYLVTLCERCHEEESGTFNHIFNDLALRLKRMFFSDGIISINHALYDCKIKGPSDYVASIIEYWLTDIKLSQEMQEKYVAHLKQGRDGKAIHGHR